MFTDMSIHQFTGRLTKDPEFQSISTGTPLLKFSLAYSTRRSSDAEGSHTSFLDVEAWGPMAADMSTLLVKGMQVIVRGELIQKRWKASDGKGRSKMNLVADQIEFSDLKRRPQFAASGKVDEN